MLYKGDVLDTSKSNQQAQNWPKTSMIILKDIPQILELISLRFPRAINLVKNPGKYPRPPVTYAFRKSPDTLDLLFLFVHSMDETWEVIKYECPSETEMEEFLFFWSKWGLYNKVLEWHHEEVNLIQ